MKDFLAAIGCFVTTIIMFSIPALIACSFCLDWSLYTKLILMMSSIVWVIVVTVAIYNNIVEDE